MTNERELREKIMRRVWGVYLFRRLMSPALRLAGLVAVGAVLVSSVSVKHIVENALSVSGFSGLTRFLFSAVLDTSFLIQSLLVLALVLIALFVRDAFESARFARAIRRAGA